MEELLKRILMNVPDVIFVFDENLRIEFVNTAFGCLMKQRTRDFFGASLVDIDTDFDDNLTPLLQRIQKNPQDPLMRTFREKREVASGGYRARDPLAPARSNENADETPRVLTLGGDIFTYQFFDAGPGDGNLKIALVLSKLTDEKKLLERLTQTESVSGLDTLAAGLAHEMNNPLFSITGHAEAILDEKEMNKIQAHAEKIRGSSRRIAKIVSDLSGYARGKGNEPKTKVNVAEMLDSAVKIAMIPFDENELIVEKNYAVISPVEAVSEELQQIFANLFENAFQAMNGKGTLFITASQSADRVRVQVQDTGPGIPQEYLSRIFNPFFTTKGQGKGTGLGLNVVHKLVKKCGGDIEVDSELGKGTVFSVIFPSSPE